MVSRYPYGENTPPGTSYPTVISPYPNERKTMSDDVLRNTEVPEPWIPLERAALCGCGAVYKINGSCPACGSSSDNSVMLGNVLAGFPKDGKGA